MSRARRRLHDDLVDVVFDVIRSAGPGPAPQDEAGQRAWAEREAARAAAKVEARRERERRSVRSYVGAGVGLMAGGLASLGLPTVAAVGVGLLAGGLATMVARFVQTTNFSAIDLSAVLPRPAPRPRTIDPPEVNGRDLPKSQRDLVQGVLDDTADHLRVIAAAADDIAGSDPDTAELCRRLVRVGEKLSDAVAETPTKFAVSQRALTYYLPRAASAVQRLADAPEGAEGTGDVRHVLARIEMYLEKTILEMHAVDTAEMGLEMRLLNQSLDEDLNPGKTP